MSAAILRNKVNPNNSTHHLTLAEAQRAVIALQARDSIRVAALYTADGENFVQYTRQSEKPAPARLPALTITSGRSASARATDASS